MRHSTVKSSCKLAVPRAPSILVTSFGSEELACEHGVIIKDESNYFIDGEVSSHKPEAGQYMFENDGILDKIA
ncbi:hypothetical protein CMV_024842 [Castanea mollissima]|uniref:Uncharacterized protein n=1 Tax=Castanea mollissima TaxID=60419 RepID=A0A8J4QMI0_9ROSI|nr:hypothetical protein CMV_024842 [Castanea mollissima]